MQPALQRSFDVELGARMAFEGLDLCDLRKTLFQAKFTILKLEVELTEAALLKAYWIDLVLVTGLGILIASALVRLTGGTSIKRWNVEIPVSWIPLLMVPVTIAHLYFGVRFNLWARTAILSNSTDVKDAFDALSNKGPLFFNGIVSRLEIVTTPVGRIFIMKWSDPTTWLVHAAAIGTFFLLVRWKGLSWLRRCGSVIFAAIIVVSNWLIGGGWAVHASCLAEAERCRAIFGLAAPGSP